jgi:hypothetical protein
MTRIRQARGKQEMVYFVIKKKDAFPVIVMLESQETGTFLFNDNPQIEWWVVISASESGDAPYVRGENLHTVSSRRPDCATWVNPYGIAKVADALKARDRILAIKEYRAATGMGLLEAKDEIYKVLGLA